MEVVEPSEVCLQQTIVVLLPALIDPTRPFWVYVALARPAVFVFV